MGVVYTVFLLFVLRDRRSPADDQPAPTTEHISARAAVRTLFQSRSFWALIVYIGLAGAAFWLINGWLPTFLQTEFAHWRPGRIWAVLLPAA